MAAVVEEYQYSAFISYRQVPFDRKWAIWLQSKIEGYRVPKKAISELNLPRRLKPAFRDEDELSAAHELSAELKGALERSEFLIVICSKSTEQSLWIDVEVRYFQSLGRTNRVLALLVEGEPPDAFPISLRRPRRERDEKDAEEGLAPGDGVLAADVRPRPHLSGRYIRRVAMLRILAALLRCRFDALRRREEVRARRQLAVRASIAAAVLLGAGLFGIVNIFQRSQIVRSRADELAQAAQSAARRQDFAAAGLLATQSLQIANSNGALETLALAKSWTWRLISTQRGHGGALGAISYSPDGQWLMTQAYFGNENVIRLWHGETLHPGPIMTHAARVYGGVFHPNARRVAVPDYEDRVWIWSFDNDRATVACTVYHKYVRDAVFETNGRFLVTYASDSALVWNLNDCAGAKLKNAPVAQVKNDGPTGFHRIALLNTLTTATADGIQLWHIESGKPVLLKTLLHRGVSGVDVSSDRADAITYGSDGVVRVWDLSGSGEAPRQELRHDKRVNTAILSTSGRIVVSASADGTAKVWELAGGRFTVKHLLAHGAEVKYALLDPGAHYVISRNFPSSPGALDGDILWVWDLETGRKTAALLTNASAVDFRADGRRLATAGFDGAATVWQVGRERVEIPRDGTFSEDAAKSALGLDANGDLILIDRFDEHVRVWNLPGGNERSVVLSVEDQILPTVMLSSDGTQIIASDGRHTVRWSASTGAPIKTEYEVDPFLYASGRRSALVVEQRPRGSRGPFVLRNLKTGSVHKLQSRLENIEESVLSANARYAAINGSIGTREERKSFVEIWDLNAETLLGRFPGSSTPAEIHPMGRSAVAFSGTSPEMTILTSGVNEARVIQQEGWVSSARYSPDGTHLVTASRDGTAWIWDTQTWEHRATLVHSAWVTHAAYDPKGDVIATTANDGSTKIWDASSHALLRVLHHHEPQRISFFSPDSKILVSLSSEKATVWAWQESLMGPENEYLALRIASAKQIKAFQSEAEAWLRLPSRIPRLNPGRRATESAARLFARPLSEGAIESAAEFVLEAPDPPRAWIELYQALSGNARANGYQLLVLEEIERRLSESYISKNEVLSLLLSAMRAEGLLEQDGNDSGAKQRAMTDIRRRADSLRSEGEKHFVVMALVPSS